MNTKIKEWNWTSNECNFIFVKSYAIFSGPTCFIVTSCEKGVIRIDDTLVAFMMFRSKWFMLLNFKVQHRKSFVTVLLPIAVNFGLCMYLATCKNSEQQYCNWFSHTVFVIGNENPFSKCDYVWTIIVLFKLYEKLNVKWPDPMALLRQLSVPQ